MSFTPPSEPAVMVFCGEPRSGKSTLIKSLMHYYAKAKVFKFGLVISGSLFNGDYDFIKTENSKWDSWDEERFKKYIQTLTDRALVLKKKGKKLPRSFIIFDDLLGTLANSDFFKSFLARFRHFGLTIFLCTQYAAEGKSCSTLLRSLTDVAFMFPSLMSNQVSACHRAWGGWHKSEDEFREVFQEVKKEDHTCLLFQKSGKTKEEAYLKFKCSPAPEKFALHF